MELNEVRIPGKVMLSGEYAVLYGAWAVLAPVGRELVVREALQTETNVSPILEHALTEPIVEIAEWEQAHPLIGVEVDRSAFYLDAPDGRRVKLGLGSSAAEAVGVIALRFARAGLEWTDNRGRVAELAERAHRAAQRGIGSGADVATAAYGQRIRFRRTGKGFETESMKVEGGSENLPLALAATGVPADTQQLVERFQVWVDQRGEALERLDELKNASDEVASAWFRAERESFFVHLDRFVEAMRRCAKGAGLEWELPLHRDLDIWARKHGGRAKPTGAGCGDLVLLVGDLPLDELDTMVIRLEG